MSDDCRRPTTNPHLDPVFEQELARITNPDNIVPLNSDSIAAAVARVLGPEIEHLELLLVTVLKSLGSVMENARFLQLLTSVQQIREAHVYTAFSLGYGVSERLTQRERVHRRKGETSVQRSPGHRSGPRSSSRREPRPGFSRRGRR